MIKPDPARGWAIFRGALWLVAGCGFWFSHFERPVTDAERAAMNLAPGWNYLICERCGRTWLELF